MASDTKGVSSWMQSLNYLCKIHPGIIFFGTDTKILIFLWYMIIICFISCSDSCPTKKTQKTPKKQNPKTKQGEKKTFFSLLALDRRKHKICPCIPLNEARWGLLDFPTLECTNMHVPLPSPSWRSFYLELSEAFFLLMGNSSARMLNPNFLTTACQWWLAPGGLWQGIFSPGEMKWSRSCPNSEHKRSHSSLFPTLPPW